MATLEQEPRVEAVLPILDRAVAETSRAFLDNPWQFHGDSGIMHFFYYRALTLGGELFFHQAGPGQIRTLLLQSEHYTKALYSQRRALGRRGRQGRLDFAFVDPSSVTDKGRVRTGTVASIGIEVGRNKSLQKMGQMGAGRDQWDVWPGDASKLIREMRYGGMPHAYLLEFYTDPTFAFRARQAYDEVVVKADGLTGLRALCFLVGGNGPVSAMASCLPVGWGNALGLDLPPIRDAPEGTAVAGLTSFERFLQKCGPCNRRLQIEISRQAVEGNLRPILTYGPKTMTVRLPDRRLLLRVTNREKSRGAPEKLEQADVLLASCLVDEGFIVPAAPIAIPEVEDDQFVGRVCRALRAALIRLEAVERARRSPTSETAWDVLDRYAGTVDAPEDWSAEHDHYLYGTPKRAGKE